jgi:predicted ATPase
MALSSEQGFALRLEQGRCSRGWALAEQGNVEDGMAQLRQSLSILEAMDAVGGQTHNLAMLAEVYGKIGQTEDGLRVLDEALAAVSRTEERFYEAELYRIKGEFLLLSGEIEPPVSPAETCFQLALDIARHQQAKSLELRATMSLCRLWRRQGKGPAARQMLAELYGWFTEGLTSADLQEAQNLLAALA